MSNHQVAKEGIRKESFFTAPARPSSSKASSFPGKRESTSHLKADAPSLPSSAKSLSDVLKVKGPQGGADRQQEALPEKIKATMEGNAVEISAVQDIPILEQLLSAGHSPPFSCLSGNCMSCLAVLKQGIVVQEEKGILEDENIQNHEILTCQAKPVSRVVEVDYDHS